MCRADKGIRPYSIGFLLDVVAGQLLAEAGGGAVLVLGLVKAGNGGVERGAGDEVLLPGDLVGRVSLALGAGPKPTQGMP